MRDCPGFAIYFGLFEFLKTLAGVSETNRHNDNYNGMRESMVTFRKFIAGGAAALFAWTFLFPFDTLKTRMQTSEMERVNAFKFAYGLCNEKGISYLYRGLHVQLARAFPTGACTMLVLDTVRTKLHQR